MALVHCRECAKDVSTEAATCPHCGIGSPAPQQPVANRTDITLPLVMAAAVALVGFLLVKAFVGGGSSPENSVDAASSSAAGTAFDAGYQSLDDRNAAKFCAFAVEKGKQTKLIL
jgi:hypothetical protein